MRTDDPSRPAEEFSLPPLAAILGDLAIGVWRWDSGTGRIHLDAEAARLCGLPAHGQSLTEAAMRACFHPVDWGEIDDVLQLALVEGTLAEARLRVLDGRRRQIRVVRTRCRPVAGANYEDGYELFGTFQEVTQPGPDAAAPTPVIGDWHRSREAFLLDAGRALAEAASTEEVLRVAAGLSMPGFSPDGLAVFGVQGERLTVIGHRGQSADDLALFSDFTVADRYPAAEVMRSGRAVYLNSRAEYQRRFPESWPLISRYPRQSWAYLPLAVGGRTLGAWMASFAYPVAFTPDERSVLATVARMLAQALSRAGAAESERELSDGLQRSMLPTLGPRIPGMSAAARYVPTGGGLQVGGDWYDMIPLPSGRFALVIGDVQGHDVRAAGLMGQLRIALRAYASEGHPPDAVLARAGRFLAGMADSVVQGSSDGGPAGATAPDPDDTRFATCLYVEVDPGSGVLEIARAGHPEPAIRLADGTVVLRPTAGGLPLGVDPDTDYPTTSFQLDPGETLLMCTDGLIETGGHDLETGWLRIREVFQEHGADDLEELADSLVQAVHGPSSHHFTGPLADRREDDIAVLLLSRTAPRRPVSGARRIALTVAQDDPERVAGARQQVRELLHDWADGEQVDSAVLLVSEALTNVLVHTDEDALLVAEVTLTGAEEHERGRRLRVEVADGSDELPHKRRPGELASSGRGLILTELLADTWGVAPQGEGKCIWFELAEREG
ncbi:SpoIIE family protein phosphatase [Streptomyces sp. NPDC058045]|uniref:ATP-binding SpoIIE family protein phosphatase n=1 Tax=Streptomyces sp. NPDC058045 TaxID=3346311 RepID=UPI0036EAF996